MKIGKIGETKAGETLEGLGLVLGFLIVAAYLCVVVTAFFTAGLYGLVLALIPAVLFQAVFKLEF